MGCIFGDPWHQSFSMIWQRVVSVSMGASPWTSRNTAWNLPTPTHMPKQKQWRNRWNYLILDHWIVDTGLRQTIGKSKGLLCHLFSPASSTIYYWMNLGTTPSKKIWLLMYFLLKHYYYWRWSANLISYSPIHFISNLYLLPRYIYTEKMSGNFLHLCLYLSFLCYDSLGIRLQLCLSLQSYYKPPPPNAPWKCPVTLQSCP